MSTVVLGTNIAMHINKIEFLITCLQGIDTDHILSDLQIAKPIDVHSFASFHLNSKSGLWEVRGRCDVTDGRKV